MDATLIILLGLVVVGLVVAFLRDAALPLRGLEASGRLVRSVWVELALGFVLAGLIEVLIPQAVVARWLGGERLVIRNIPEHPDVGPGLTGRIARHDRDQTDRDGEMEHEPERGRWWPSHGNAFQKCPVRGECVSCIRTCSRYLRQRQ